MPEPESLGCERPRGHTLLVKQWCALMVFSAIFIASAGCAAVGVALLGAGATAGAAHHINGINYRTFTRSLARTEAAAQAALNRMGIIVESTERADKLSVIKGSTPTLTIEVQLESLTAQSTRVRTVAYQHGGLMVDAATANEIIRQTEAALSSRPGSKKQRT
jgi:Protein of unknown function (DUF3568)